MAEVKSLPKPPGGGPPPVNRANRPVFAPLPGAPSTLPPSPFGSNLPPAPSPAQFSNLPTAPSTSPYGSNLPTAPSTSPYGSNLPSPYGSNLPTAPSTSPYGSNLPTAPSTSPYGSSLPSTSPLGSNLPAAPSPYGSLGSNLPSQFSNTPQYGSNLPSIKPAGNAGLSNFAPSGSGAGGPSSLDFSKFTQACYHKHLLNQPTPTRTIGIPGRDDDLSRSPGKPLPTAPKLANNSPQMDTTSLLLSNGFTSVFNFLSLLSSLSSFLPFIHSLLFFPLLSSLSSSLPCIPSFPFFPLLSSLSSFLPFIFFFLFFLFLPSF